MLEIALIIRPAQIGLKSRLTIVEHDHGQRRDLLLDAVLRQEGLKPLGIGLLCTGAASKKSGEEKSNDASHSLRPPKNQSAVRLNRAGMEVKLTIDQPMNIVAGFSRSAFMA